MTTPFSWKVQLIRTEHKEVMNGIYYKDVAECFRIIGRTLSPPIAFEESKLMSAMKVSSREISSEQGNYREERGRS